MRSTPLKIYSFCLFPAVLLLVILSNNVWAAPVFYPNEAKTLATDITGSSNPPAEVVAEIQLNLDAIRTLYPEMNHVTIFPRDPWIIGDGSDIRIYGNTYRFIKKWGDCPAGCIYQENYSFLTDRGAIKLTSGYTDFSADINGDGVVNLLELNILGDNWNTPEHATVFHGDLNGDAQVTLLDLDILGSEMQNHTEIPSPSSAAFLAIGSSLLMFHRRLSHAA